MGSSQKQKVEVWVTVWLQVNEMFAFKACHFIVSR